MLCNISRTVFLFNLAQKNRHLLYPQQRIATLKQQFRWAQSSLVSVAVVGLKGAAEVLGLCAEKKASSTDVPALSEERALQARVRIRETITRCQGSVAKVSEEVFMHLLTCWKD